MFRSAKRAGAEQERFDSLKRAASERAGAEQERSDSPKRAVSDENLRTPESTKSKQPGHTSPKRLLSYPENPPSPASSDFLLAAERGDLPQVKRYIAANEHNLRAMNVTTNVGLTALSLAARKGHFDVVNALLDVEKTNIDAHERHEETALHFASYAGHTRIVMALLAAGAKFTWEKEVLKKVEEKDFTHIANILNWQDIRLPSLRSLMSEYGLTLDRDTISAVLGLTPKRYALFYQMTSEMVMTGKMNNASFLHTLQRVMQRYAHAPEQKVKRTEHKHGDQYDTQNQLSIFVKHHAKTNPEYVGGQGIINKGFCKEPTDTVPTYTTPTFAVKWVRRTQDAAHEAKYHHFFPGRSNTFWFRSEKRLAVVYTWFGINTLNEYKPTQNGTYPLAAYPLATRLACLTHFLGEINLLHSTFRAHKDIKAANCVFDPVNCRLEVIDFGLAKKVQDTFGFQQDMYDIINVIKTLFPDLKKGEPSIIKEAINKLIHAINPANTKIDSCTSEQAWQFCQALLDNACTLDAQSLDVIASQTIFRKDITVEDVLRGRRLV